MIRKSLVVMVVAAFTVMGGDMAAHAQSAQNNRDVYRTLELFGDALTRIRADYVEEVDDTKLLEAGLNGMLSSLDPHSAFLSPERSKQMEASFRGEFGGLGIEVTMEKGILKVVAPLDDTPAAKAGMQSGDVISHIDSEPVLGLTLPQAVKKMRGAVGEDIVLTILRRSESEPFDVTITRAIIKVRSVRARAEGNVAYIRITSFTEQTTPGLLRSMAMMKSEIGPDISGVVLDLRNNPGGLLNQAVNVADAFLDRGEIVSTRGRNDRNIERHRASEGDISDGLPVVVLINGGSASAAEIVAGALKDHKRGILMGTRSFGKGSVQTIVNLSDGYRLKLTTARYYTPAGTSIQATGIEPDILVPHARLEIIDQPRRLSEAGLRNRLDNDTPTDGGDDSGATMNGDGNGAGNADGNADGAADGAADTAADAPDTAPERADYQLQRALDTLRAIALFAASARAN